MTVHADTHGSMSEPVSRPLSALSAVGGAICAGPGSLVRLDLDVFFLQPLDASFELRNQFFQLCNLLAQRLNRCISHLA